MRGLSRTRSAIAAIFAAVVFTLVGASAASAVVPGGLLAAGCVGSSTPCVAVSQVGTPTDIVVSPDGANVYVTMSSSALVVFQRNAATGQLAFQQCFRGVTAVTGCTALPIIAANTLSSPTAIAVTPDGAHVYVASAGTSTIHEFSRAGDGSLALKAGSPCVATLGGPPPAACTDARAMASPQDLVVEGGSLYVASSGTPGGVTAFTIGADGSLDQANSGAECVQQSNSDNCTVGRGLQGASSIAVRGTKIYVGTAAGRMLTVNRDPGYRAHAGRHHGAGVPQRRGAQRLHHGRRTGRGRR